MRRSIMVVLVTAAVLSAAGCTSGSSDDKADAAHPSNAPTTQSTASPPPKFIGVAHKLPKGKALRNDSDLYKTVGLETCEKTAHGWQAGGTVDNPTGKEVGYAITVFFTDPQARTVDSALATLTVDAGASATWQAARSFKAPKHTRCVVRAVGRTS
jgi:hypothetical protein